MDKQRMSQFDRSDFDDDNLSVQDLAMRKFMSIKTVKDNNAQMVNLDDIQL